MNKFINLPNGDSLRSDSIVAIRKGDPVPHDGSPHGYELKPRVIVDFTVGEHGNCIVLSRDTVEERDALADDLKTQILS